MTPEEFRRYGHQLIDWLADYHESLLDGLRVYHNPKVTHKLNKDIFRDNDVFQSYYSVSTRKTS